MTISVGAQPNNRALLLHTAAWLQDWVFYTLATSYVYECPHNVAAGASGFTYLIRHDLHPNFVQGKIVRLGHLLSDGKNNDMRQVTRRRFHRQLQCAALSYL